MGIYIFSKKLWVYLLSVQPWFPGWLIKRGIKIEKLRWDTRISIGYKKCWSPTIFFLDAALTQVVTDCSLYSETLYEENIKLTCNLFYSFSI